MLMMFPISSMICNVECSPCLNICYWFMYMLPIIFDIVSWGFWLFLYVERMCRPSYISSRGWVADKAWFYHVMPLLQLINDDWRHCILGHVFMILERLMLHFLILHKLLMVRMFMLLSLWHLYFYYQMTMLEIPIWCMIDDYHGLATSLFRSCILVLSVIYVSSCKVHEKIHVVTHCKIHSWMSYWDQVMSCM